MGSAAQFRNASGLAVDGTGNIYVADRGNRTIRKVRPDGLVSTFAGLAGEFGSPDGVAVDGSGNVYVARGENHAIYKITPAGAVSTLAGLAGTSGNQDGTGSAARFNRPRDVAADSAGNVYVADSFNGKIRKITSGGVVTTLASSISDPDGVAVDGAGNVYVASKGCCDGAFPSSRSSTIRKVTPNGVVTTLVSASDSADGTGSVARFDVPQSLAVDGAGNIYVADTGNSTIRKITNGGVVSTLAGLAGTVGSSDGTGSAARFFVPSGVAVDGAGNVYVADSANNTIRKITPGGVVSTLAGLAGTGNSGRNDGTGSAARFFQPKGVAVDSAGNVYVADSYNDAIRKITPKGVVSTLAGGDSGSADGTGSAAQFRFPHGVAVDKAGNVYVADTFNGKIRKITPKGVVSTLTGAAVANQPHGVAVDSAGNVYIADTRNDMIRKLSPNGALSILAGGIDYVDFAFDDGSGPFMQFAKPQGVAVDGAGTVYVADTENSTIRLGVPSLPSRLANISTRLRVETGDNVLIGGFIVTGTQPKKIIVRGIGPSLPLANKLANPTLELRNSSGALLHSNDDWQQSPNKKAIIDSTIPPTNDLESAIVATLPAGNAGYTAIVRGKDNSSGIGVVEAYDLDTSTNSKLANISTRGFVQNGDNVLIAGTIVLGEAPQYVIVRAIGPSLTGLGVAGALRDPILELRDGNGEVVRSNDDWRDDQEAEIIATTIPPTNDSESAIVTTLPSNGASYTAIVRGVSSTTGIAVVEVYGLD
jgi:sugar lactone lactonase YvrE